MHACGHAAPLSGHRSKQLIKGKNFRLHQATDRLNNRNLRRLHAFSLPDTGLYIDLQMVKKCQRNPGAGLVLMRSGRGRARRPGCCRSFVVSMTVTPVASDSAVALTGSPEVFRF